MRGLYNGRYKTYENVHQVIHSLGRKRLTSTTSKQDVAEQRTRAHTPSAAFIHERTSCVVL